MNLFFRSAYIITLCLLSLSAHAKQALYWSVSPYHSVTDYASSSVQDISTSGLYVYLGKNKHSLELEWDHIRARNHDSVIQNSQLAIYTWYPGSLRIKGGIERVRPTGSEGKGGVILSGIAVDHYDFARTKRWSLGTDFYYSSYDISLVPGRFQVWQLAPYITSHFRLSKNSGVSSMTARMHMVSLSDGSLTTDTHYRLLNFKIIHPWHKWTTTLNMWVGDTAYALLEDGYVLYNGGRVIGDGYALQAHYQWKKRLSLKIKWHKQNFNLLSASKATEKSHFKKVMLMLSYNI